MTIIEQDFMRRVPSALFELVKAVESLTKEVSELKEELKKAKGEGDE